MKKFLQRPTLVVATVVHPLGQMNPHLVVFRTVHISVSSRRRPTIEPGARRRPSASEFADLVETSLASDWDSSAGGASISSMSPPGRTSISSVGRMSTSSGISMAPCSWSSSERRRSWHLKTFSQTFLYPPHEEKLSQHPNPAYPTCFHPIGQCPLHFVCLRSRQILSFSSGQATGGRRRLPRNAGIRRVPSAGSSASLTSAISVTEKSVSRGN